MKLIDKLLSLGSVKLEGRRLQISHPPAVVLADDIANMHLPPENCGPLRCPVNGMWIEFSPQPFIAAGHHHTFGCYVYERPDLQDNSGDFEIWIEPYIWFRPKPPEVLPLIFGACVCPNGDLLGSNLYDLLTMKEAEDAWADGTTKPITNEREAAGYFVGLITNVAFHTIGFMNAANVKTDSHEPSAKLSKAHQRRTGGPPLVKWVTIRLPNAARAGEGTGSNPGVMPLHIARGHFKTYTADKPLFGKVEGTWWWPAVARGNPKAGIRLHEYETNGAGKNE